MPPPPPESLIFVCMYTCMYLCRCACACRRVYVCIHVSVHVYAGMYTCGGQMFTWVVFLNRSSLYFLINFSNLCFCVFVCEYTGPWHTWRGPRTVLSVSILTFHPEMGCLSFAAVCACELPAVLQSLPPSPLQWYTRPQGCVPLHLAFV